MAIASAKAIPRNIGTKSLSADSGLRPIDSMALLAVIPIAKAGNIPPTAMVRPLTRVSIISGLIYIPFLLLLMNYLLKFRPENHYLMRRLVVDRHSSHR